MKNKNTTAYSHYVLFILTLTYTCSYLDRYVLSVLIEPIKADLNISDTQLGLLGGFAFALLYTIAGIPIARWADRGNRRSIIALGAAAWSIMTVSCGLVKTFPQFLLARVGVGLGEAACTPPAHSLIADYFPVKKRATALSFYSMGIPLGVMLGFLCGGWIAHYFNWRVAFIVVGAPGLLLALVVRFTIAEPKRGGFDEKDTEANTDEAKNTYSLKQAIRFMVGNRALMLIQLGGAFYAFAGYGLSFWIAPFFSRVHGMPLQQLASGLAVAAFFGGVSGAYCAGRFADFFGRRGLHWYLITITLALLVGLPFTVLMIVVDSPMLALLLFGVQQFTFACYSGPVFATMQFLVPAKMRALVVAIHLFILNLVGLGLGPLVIGMMNDYFSVTFSDATAIKTSLLLITSSAIVAMMVFALAAFSLKKSQRVLAVSA